MSSAEFQHLLNVLDERDTGLGRDDVAWAFESTKTKSDANAWVVKYLSAATLLSREELAFCQQYWNEDVATAQAGAQLSNEDVESAIASLEASTAAIEKQCRTLEVQRNALREIRSRNRSGQRVGKDNGDHHDRLTRERAQTDFEADELANSIQSQVQASMKQIAASTTSMQPTVERTLEKDDRALDGLERVLPQLNMSRNSNSTVDEVEQLCRTLVAQSSADIRSRIDAAYNAAIYGHAVKSNGVHVNGDATSLLQSRETVRTELDELCREIDGLSVMAVDSQYRKPISQALEKLEEDGAMERDGWSQYVRSTLQYLTARLDMMDSHFHHVHAHHAALKTVSAAVEGITTTLQAKNGPTKTGLHSPSKASQKGLKPLRLVQANLSDAQDPVVHFLRHIDIRLPDSTDLAKLSDNIPSVVKEKGEKVTSFSYSSNQSVTDQLVESLAKAHTDGQALLGAVYHTSQYGNIGLVNEHAGHGIDRLERKTQQMSNEMRELDVDGIATDLRRKQRSLAEELSIL